ncbi:MAG: hypothetical protein ABL998_11970, partial [Planctomycetota bacterium]
MSFGQQDRRLATPGVKEMVSKALSGPRAWSELRSAGTMEVSRAVLLLPLPDVLAPGAGMIRLRPFVALASLILALASSLAAQASPRPQPT